MTSDTAMPSSAQSVQATKRRAASGAASSRTAFVPTVVRAPSPRTWAERASRWLIPGTDLIAAAAGVTIIASTDALRTGMVIYAVLALIILSLSGSHVTRINPRLGQDLPGLVGRMAAPLLIVVMLSDQAAVTVRVAGMTTLLLLFGRAASYGGVRWLREHGHVCENTLIVGAGDIGVDVANMLRQHPEFGLVPIGFLDTFTEPGLPLPVLGSAARLAALTRAHDVRRVLVAYGRTPEPELVRHLRDCDDLDVAVHVIPRFFELGVAGHSTFDDDLWGIPLLRLRRAALQLTSRRTKRLFDVVASALILTLVLPIFVLCALAVKLSSRGPVFFQQDRVGQQGRLVRIRKFRTMHLHPDSDTRWGVDPEDGRITRVGRFLRASSLDELPQLINVFRGDMSLVGPRPERPVFVDQFAVEIPRYDDRHRVPAGITGWAQVHGLRGETPINERARFDNAYVENWSLWHDIRILARTVQAVLTHRGR